MQFVLLTNMTDWAGPYTLLARSPVVDLAWLNEPLWGHLALTGKPGCAFPRKFAWRAAACEVHSCMRVSHCCLCLGSAWHGF